MRAADVVPGRVYTRRRSSTYGPCYPVVFVAPTSERFEREGEKYVASGGKVGGGGYRFKSVGYAVAMLSISNPTPEQLAALASVTLAQFQSREKISVPSGTGRTVHITMHLEYTIRCVDDIEFSLYQEKQKEAARLNRERQQEREIAMCTSLAAYTLLMERADKLGIDIGPWRESYTGPIKGVQLSLADMGKLLTWGEFAGEQGHEL